MSLGEPHKCQVVPEESLKGLFGTTDLRTDWPGVSKPACRKYLDNFYDRQITASLGNNKLMAVFAQGHSDFYSATKLSLIEK